MRGHLETMSWRLASPRSFSVQHVEVAPVKELAQNLGLLITMETQPFFVSRFGPTGQTRLQDLSYEVSFVGYGTHESRTGRLRRGGKLLDLKPGSKLCGCRSPRVGATVNQN
jgi:hypothetical protein